MKKLYAGIFGTRTGLWGTTLALGLQAFLAQNLSGCTTGDDETPTPTAVPETPTPTATPDPFTPPPVVNFVGISGTVTAVDRTTGDVLDASTYAARSGKIVVYALLDPADLAHPVAKATLEGPGYYNMDVPENSGTLYIVAVADVDWDEVITSADLMREAALSPVTVAATGYENVDITLDVVEHGGGGGGPIDYSPFSGNVFYDDVDADRTNIAVVGFRGDYASRVWGKSVQVGPGPYNLSVAIYGESTAIVAYADLDGNGLYEPCDPAGLAEGNAYALNQQGATGVDILIAGVGPVGLPQPIPYVSISGTVVAADNYSGTPILVTVRATGTAAVVGSVSLPAPGNFTLRLPGKIGSVDVTAITDSDADGALNPLLDANGVASATVGSSSVGGVSITMTQPLTDTGISGRISYSGTPGPNDRIVVALFGEEGTVADPLLTQIYTASFPTPLDYSILELAPGTYTVLAMLDVNGDWTFGQEPTVDDVVGAYTLNGTSLLPISVVDKQVTSGINFTLGNYSIH